MSTKVLNVAPRGKGEAWDFAYADNQDTVVDCLGPGRRVVLRKFVTKCAIVARSHRGRSCGRWGTQLFAGEERW